MEWCGLVAVMLERRKRGREMGAEKIEIHWKTHVKEPFDLSFVAWSGALETGLPIFHFLTIL